VATTALDDALALSVLDALAADAGVDVSRVTLSAVHTSRRDRTTVHVLDIEVDGRERRVVLKVVPPEPRRGHAERPRLAPLFDRDEVAALEHRGLVTIQRQLTVVDDPRFGYVRPIALLGDHRAVLMHHVDAPTFRASLVRRHRLRGEGAPDLVAAADNTGAWLRAYQDTENQGAPVRHDERAEIVEVVERFAKWFTGLRDGEPAAALARSLARAAPHVLPDRLPVALGHGDFAPRNVLVRPDGQVTVIDPLPRWRVPVYEDAACFLVSLRLVGPRLVAPAYFRRGMVEGLADRFVESYTAGAASGRGGVAVYEGIVLLDTWSAILAAGSEDGSWARRARVFVSAPTLRAEARRIAERLARVQS